MTSPLIAICDDEPAIRKTLSEVLEDDHFSVVAVESGEAMVELLGNSEQRVDAVLLDVWLPGIDGLDTLSRIRDQGHGMPVIMISGHATLDSAVRATRNGAFDFLEKPLNLDRVMISLNNALKQSQLERTKRQLAGQLPDVDMVGSSRGIQQLREEISLAARGPARVLILGESGSGKELAARMIHDQSDRADESFVEMNCAAIPEELIESELFGHVKGSFTGAIEDRRGKFEEADRGTLFLDEIGDMSLQTQAKVLRVLQEQRFQRIGHNKTVMVDVRVIAATNKDLEAEIEAGRFRKDLYYRLNVVPISVPPLRQRLDDIPILCAHFSRSFSKSYGRSGIRFSKDALEHLTSYPWPGNVRELRNIVERLMIMCRHDEVTAADLPGGIRGESHDSFLSMHFESLRDARDYFEKKFIEHHLRLNAWNVTKTADVLVIERSHLHRKIKQFGIKEDDRG